MSLPPQLLRAATEGEGRVVFVLGAGCSVEPPTSLPLAHDCSRAAHQRLVDDGVIAEGACADPDSLEDVADLVVATTGSKSDLVSRLPRQKFLLATPNKGHDVLAALMAERIVRAALTINFDLAINTALANAGIDDVTTIDGAGDHEDLGNASVIYLHRSAHAPDEVWVLTSDEVHKGWEDEWNRMLAGAVLTAPAVVFIGMGTLVGVLLASARRVREAVPHADSVFQVDPVPREESRAFEVLRPEEDNYIQMGWISFAVELGDRVNQHHLSELVASCEALASDNDWGEIDVQHVKDGLAAAGLLAFGSARARWFLADGEYLAWRKVRPTWVAELVIALEKSRVELAAEIVLSNDGTILFSKDDRTLGALGYLHGQASMRWSQLHSEMAHRQEHMDNQQETARAFVVAGVEGRQPDQFSTPNDIVAQSEPVDVMAPVADPQWLTVDQLREEPELLRRAFES